MDVARETAKSTDMERVLIIGASGGIGHALCAAYTARGSDVVALSRGQDGLDLTCERSVADMLGALDGGFDVVVVATGALAIDGAAPEKTIKTISAKAMTDQFLLNAVGPALVMKEAGRLLARKRRAVFAVLSARVGSIGDNRLGGWVSYRAAKAALNQILHTGAIEVARTHPEAICVALHPGTVATPFTRDYLGRHPAVPPEEAAGNLIRVMDALEPSDTGGFRDWSGAEVPW